MGKRCHDKEGNMNHPIKRSIITWGLFCAAVLYFLLPTHAIASGTIKINKNEVLQLTQADTASKGGGPAVLPQQVSPGSGASSADTTQRTLKAIAKSGYLSKTTYWAKLTTRFTVDRGNRSEIYGRVRVQIENGKIKGYLSAAGTNEARVFITMNVADLQKHTDEGKAILIDSKIAGNKTIDKTFINAIEITVIAGRTYEVDLYLEAYAVGTNLLAGSTSDFMSGNGKVSFDAVKVTMIEAIPLVTGPARYK